MRDAHVVMTGLGLGESPRWHEGRLWYCDWGAQWVGRLAPDGTEETICRIEAFPFCIDWMPDGRLLVVAGSRRTVLRREADGTLTCHADLAGLPVQGWNEIVVSPAGCAYVNGGSFDFSSGSADATGVIACIDAGGEPRVVAEGLAFPNGMALAGDGRTLIVAESHRHCLTAFDTLANGDLSNRRVWADLGEGVPDGLTVDAEGAVWYADVPNRRTVRVREGGMVLDTVHVDRGCFACALGGADGRSLYIVAAEWRGFQQMGAVIAERTGRILRVDVPVPAAGNA